MNTIMFLAQVDGSALEMPQSANSSFNEVLIMGGGLFVAILLGTLWAVAYSKKKKNNRPPRQRHNKSKDRPLQFRDPNEPPPEDSERRKYRKQRRPHRPMNPTLAQTGGLPPMRDKDTPLPPMP